MRAATGIWARVGDAYNLNLEIWKNWTDWILDLTRRGACLRQGPADIKCTVPNLWLSRNVDEDVDEDADVDRDGDVDGDEYSENVEMRQDGVGGCPDHHQHPQR